MGVASELRGLEMRRSCQVNSGPGSGKTKPLSRDEMAIVNRLVIWKDDPDSAILTSKGTA